MTDYTVAVLEDAIQLLNVLKQHEAGVTLAQMTDETGLVKNKVFRLLYTLEKHQLAERDAEGRYHLGMRMLSYAKSVERQNRLLEASQGVMDLLMEETGETIFLGVVSGQDALCVAARESTQSIRLYAEVGRRAPLHSGGVPKALLAHLPQDHQAELLQAFDADAAAPDLDLLRAQLPVIQQHGYVVVVDELDMGAHSVAAPIFNYDNEVVAAISIAGPSHRFTASQIETYIELIQQAAAQISEKLGHRPSIPVQ